ncbi:hypothetical protein QBC35DRAFT_233124 [Podospora australis]|uniref:Uncharacterized protein n=1 Tax=Podospora australis TaxID=1536484 RepID=A0AAN7AJ28_9PEZI|nr:hypothetical protein QBC35DRAFT_233124 [Podospora australis]
MRFSVATLFAAGLASTGVLAAPQANKALDPKLAERRPVVEDAPVKRSKNPARELEIAARQGCLIGLPCTSDSDCWFNGCDGCLFLSTSAGACYGSIM